jgi:hypothetical protein
MFLDIVIQWLLQAFSLEAAESLFEKFCSKMVGTRFYDEVSTDQQRDWIFRNQENNYIFMMLGGMGDGLFPWDPGVIGEIKKQLNSKKQSV